MEADLFGASPRWCIHELSNGLEDDGKLLVVRGLEFGKLLSQLLMRRQQPAKVRTTWMLACTARVELRTLASIRAPCSVNA